MNGTGNTNRNQREKLMRFEVTVRGFMEKMRVLIRAAGLSYRSPFFFSKPATLPNFFLPDSIRLINDITNVNALN